MKKKFKRFLGKNIFNLDKAWFALGIEITAHLKEHFQDLQLFTPFRKICASLYKKFVLNLVFRRIGGNETKTQKNKAST